MKRSRAWHSLAGVLLVVAALDATRAQEPVEGMNLLENPSFEEHAPIRRNRSKRFSAIPGWSAPHDRLELHDGRSAGIGAADGDTKLGLDTGSNVDVFQDLTLAPDARYRLQLFYAPEHQHGTTNDMEVLWNDSSVARLSGNRRYWRRHVFDLETGSADARLLLRGAGRVDGRGALVDALTLSRVPYVTGNRITNGSFEDPDSFGHHSHRLFDEIPGWAASAGAIELRRHRYAGLDPYEGRTLLSVDGRYADRVEQTLGLEPGRRYDLEIGFAPRRASGGDAVEVWLGDERVAVLEGDRKQWHRHRVVVQARDPLQTLSLRAPSRTDQGHSPGHGHGHGHGYGHGKGHGYGHAGKNQGGLIDDVRLYGACWASDNLLTNPSFEEHPALGHDDQGVFLTIPGWRAVSGHIEIHRYGFRGRSLMAAEGRDHLELGGNGQTEVAQEVATEPGARYLLEFAYSPRIENPGTGRNDVQVWWDGAVVATVGGERRGWQFLRVPVRATSVVSELRFAGVYARDGRGGQIDEVRLLRVADITIASEPLISIRVGEPYSHAVTLVDGVDGPVRFALLDGPEGMHIDPATGLITWEAPVAGTHPVHVSVIDACGRGGRQAFELEVTGSNQAPVIVSVPVTVTPLFHLRPVITVVDDNPGSVSVRLNGSPYVSATPLSADGSYTLEVDATDAAGTASSRSVQFVIDRGVGP